MVLGMQELEISIVIATFNAAKTLERCLQSIVPQLTDATELVIVDGGSEDETLSIIKKYEQYVAYTVSEPDKGIYDAWNKGVKVAHGEWIMFIGADDILLPNALTLYLTKLKKVSISCQLVSSKRTMYGLDGKPIYTVGAIWNWRNCINGMTISHPGALHRRTLFDEIGLFDLSYKICADYELLMRKGNRLESDFMDMVTVNMQVGGMSDSYAAIKEYYLILKNTVRFSWIKSIFRYWIMLTKYTVKHALKRVGINYHA